MEIEREAVNLGKLLESTVGLVEASITAKRQKLTVDIESGLPDLLVDAEQIERVFLNLLSNANKFTPAGGAIGVQVRSNGTTVVAEITDNGRGIPEGDQANIFGEYYRGSNADGAEGAGTGLGLAIAKQLVEIHGGEITFTSAEGDGTAFRVVLPLLSDLERPEQAIDAESDGGSLPGQT